jgi:hypothetical protein
MAKRQPQAWHWSQNARNFQIIERPILAGSETGRARLFVGFASYALPGRLPKPGS